MALKVDIFRTYSEISVLDEIKNNSGVVWERDLSAEIAGEVQSLMKSAAFLGFSKKVKSRQFSEFFAQQFSACPFLRLDMLLLTEKFAEITESDELCLVCKIVENDMCRKFHTDITDYRLLCTYAGEGTYVGAFEEEKQTSEQPDFLHILSEGDVLIFRGALSATKDCPPLLHKSPPVASNGNGKRFLFRIDTSIKNWL